MPIQTSRAAGLGDGVAAPNDFAEFVRQVGRLFVGRPNPIPDMAHVNDRDAAALAIGVMPDESSKLRLRLGPPAGSADQMEASEAAPDSAGCAQRQGYVR